MSTPSAAALDLSSLPVEFNPFLPEFHENPYPFYHRLRSLDPVHWSDIAGRWVLTRYSDCVAVLRDAARFSADPNTWSGFTDFVAAQGGPGPLMDMQTNWMLHERPPRSHAVANARDQSVYPTSSGGDASPCTSDC